jgi:hypothetical protein
MSTIISLRWWVRRSGSGLWSVLALAFATTMLGGSSSANATTIFGDDFSGYSGNQNANQVDTGLPVAFGGSVTGWTGGGFNALHAVDQGGGNWAIMFYYDNTLTLSSGIAGNVSGSNYFVDFNYGTATYADASQNTTASDGLIVQILRADDGILAQQTGLPGTWGPGSPQSRSRPPRHTRLRGRWQRRRAALRTHRQQRGRPLRGNPRQCRVERFGRSRAGEHPPARHGPRGSALVRSSPRQRLASLRIPRPRRRFTPAPRCRRS